MTFWTRNVQLFLPAGTRPNLWASLSTCLCCAAVTDTVVLLYRAATITANLDSSVILNCEAQYNFRLCSLLHLVWIQGTTELTSPSRYLTTVSEQITGEDMRRRYMSTEILQLTPEDAGSYQCQAQCQNGDSALGHFIRINVKGTGLQRVISNSGPTVEQLH